MSNTQDTPYPFPYDEDEIQRLNMQHRLITAKFGYDLSPRIKIGGGDVILDNGCGTGAWAISLNAQLDTSPTPVKFVCADISNYGFPSSVSPSANIQFETHPALSLPNEWTNKFQVVHQRLMQVSITRSEWPTVLSGLYRVLKPGGWLQLVEVDYGAVLTPEFRAAAPAMTELLEHFRATAFVPFDNIWDTRAVLPGLIEQAGFRNLSIDERAFGLEGAVAGRAPRSIASGVDLRELSQSEGGETLLEDVALDMLLQALESVKGGSEEYLKQLAGRCSTEWKDVAKAEPRLGARWYTYCAQKTQ